ANKDLALINSGSSWEIWNLRARKEISELQNSPWDLARIEFSQNARLVISKWPVFRVWDAATGQLLVSSLAFKNGDWVTITPEGFFDASPGGAKMLNVVRGLEAYSINQVYQALYRPDLVKEKLAGDPAGKVKAAAARL